jgi:hypothetical protein
MLRWPVTISGVRRSLENRAAAQEIANGTVGGRATARAVIAFAGMGAGDDPPDPPGSGDVADAIAKAALSVIPILGGPVAELFDLLRLPAAKRQYAWLSELAVRLKQLESEKRLRVEDVVHSDAFVSATIRGLEAARRTVEREKLDALRNGVLNVALSHSIDESLTQMFLDWIDRFTVPHLRLLRAADDPRSWSKDHNLVYNEGRRGPLFEFLAIAFSDLAEHPDVLDLLWADLFQAGLVTIPVPDMHHTASDHGFWPSRTTRIGKAFLRFIESE